MTTPVIEYRRPRRPSVRFYIALAFTMASGVAAGVMAALRFHSGWLLYAYPFVCTLVMGWVAGRKQVIIALAACGMFATTWIGIEMARDGRADAAFVFSEALPYWIAAFMIAAIGAALALPLAMVRIRLRRQRKI